MALTPALWPGALSACRLFIARGKRLSRYVLLLGVGGMLVFRILVMYAALCAPERAVKGVDERVYTGLAGSMLKGAGFTLHDTRDAPRSITRVPVYPLLIAVVRKISGPSYIRVMIILQNLAALVTSLIIFRFVKRRYGARSARIALIILLADIPLIVYSDLLLTEITCLFLSVVSVIFFIRMIEEMHPWRDAIISGCCASLAALCRPIYQLLPLLFAAAGLAVLWRERRRVAPRLALFLIVYGAGIAPWIARNYLVYGGKELTYLGVLDLYFYKAGGAVSVVEGKDIEEVKAAFESYAVKTWGIKNMHEDPHRAELMSFALRVIMQHPIAFGRSTLSGFIGNAITPEKGALYSLFGMEAPRFGMLWSNGGGASRFLASLRSFGMGGISLILFQMALLLAIYWSIGYGLIHGRIRCTDLLVAVSVTAVFYYYLCAAGAESTGRFRIPAMPYLSILVAIAWGSGYGRRESDR